jgi:crotonyl-CoA carboxylase/reductase
MTTTVTVETQVKDVMHRGVLTCARETPLAEVARTMAQERVHCIVVADGGEVEDLWGVISGADVVAAALAGNVDTRLAGEAAASPVVMVAPEDPLERAAQLMLEHGTDHLVVADTSDLRPVGVVSTLDVAAAVSESMRLETMGS